MDRYARLRTIPGDSESASEVWVEACLRRGLPGVQVSGAGRGAREMAERLRSALHHCQLRLPLATLSLNVSGRGQPRNAADFELSFAAATLLALGMGPPGSLLRSIADSNSIALFGELSLSGDLLPTPALIAKLWRARGRGFTAAVVPESQQSEAIQAGAMPVIALHKLPALLSPAEPRHPAVLPVDYAESTLDGAFVNGDALRAVTLAAAGWHSLLFLGPPGAGKTALATELVALLPPPDQNEAAAILAQSADPGFPVRRPLRRPHHSATRRAMIGGGSQVEAGEITRAHCGVLLLDELGEFRRETLQALREPVEQAELALSRGAASRTLPAQFLLAATSNACPCGYLGASGGQCRCTPTAIDSYRIRLLGPLSDRLEIQYRMGHGEERSARAVRLEIDRLREGVFLAQQRQAQRYQHESIGHNGRAELDQLKRLCPISERAAVRLWTELCERNWLSLRQLRSVYRLAATAMDLEGAAEINEAHLLEAAALRGVLAQPAGPPPIASGRATP